MNIKFYVKGTKPFNTVHVRFYNGKVFDTCTSTNLMIKKEHWNYSKNELKRTGCFKNYQKVKEKLSAVETSIYENYQIDFLSGTLIDNLWLRSVVFKVFNRPANEAKKQFDDKHIYFVDWARNWIKNAENNYIKKNEKTFSKDDKYNFDYTLDYLMYFQQYSKKKFKFSDLNKEVKINYKKYLKEKELLTADSIKVALGKLGFLFDRADTAKMPICKTWKEVDNNVDDSDEADMIFLDETEINAIYNLDLCHPDNNDLEAARDNFIIGLRSGLRVSDYLVGLSEELLSTGQIKCITKKTKTKVVIPIHPQVRKILMKWNGLPPSFREPKFNKLIKRVAELAEINEITFGGVLQGKVELYDGRKAKRKIFKDYPKWKLVVSHTARRSFATNLYLDGVDNQTIMEVGGWKTENQMLSYVKKFGDKASKRVAKNWDVEIKPIIFKKIV